MARTKRSENRKGDVIGYITVSFAWCMWLMVTLSCVSYHAYDRRFGIDPNHYTGAVHPPCHNWCGPVGATIAHDLLFHIGPGIFVALVMIAAFLVVWTKGAVISQFILRVLGGVMLVAIFSSMFYLAKSGTAGIEEVSGGMLGNALGSFLMMHFHMAGTGILLMLSTIVALLLVADEIMLAVPGLMAHVWHRMPREQMVGVASGAAGGLWHNLREMAGHMGNRRRMGAPQIELNKGRKKKNPDENGAGAGAGKVEVKNPKEGAGEAGAAASGPVVPGVAAEAVKTGTEVADPDLDAPTPTIFPEPVVRKPTPAKTMMLPFKPVAPAPSPKQDFAAYKLPGVDLLDEAEPINQEGHEKRVREKAKVLESTLESFGVKGKVEAIDTGPVVTLYELSLAPGVKSAQVAALAKDIARALMSPPIRIIDNIPGKSTMGVEVPNIDRERVRLKELMVLGHDQIERMALPMCLGKDASGNPLIEDLAKIPHLLIAGTTGSGKSVCINSIIMTILLTQRPDHVKLIMVDPKMVEMQDYKCIPHLMAPIIDDMAKAESILEWATQKMDERYEIMSEAQVRHIKEFNKLTRDQMIERFSAITEDDKAKLMFHMPYIVIIIDELADLMMTSKEVEGHIVRIAQKARAVGIHLILATQRPEAQVVTGLIKSNMPGRICFQVRSRLDSRIMLDQSGGELLLGQGDMLVLRPTGGGLLRAQGSFVDDNEIKRVSKFLKEIAQPEFHPELVQLGTPSGLAEGEEKDPLYNDAVDIMIESGRGSVSLIQRRLNIGYSRASRLIDQMRRTGIVGAYKGSQASEVTVTKEEWEAMKLSESSSMATVRSSDGAPGATGPMPGSGSSAGFAQQTNSTFDEDDDGGVPDEMPGEHRL